MTFVQKTKSLVTKKGAQFFATPFGESGVISISGSLSGGYMRAKNAAISDLHAAMLTEGTKKHSKKFLQEKLDSMGTSISFSVAPDRLEFAAKTRKEHLKAVLELIAEMLTMPLFSAKELSIVKARTLGALSLEAENTRTQSSIALARLLYDVGHPNRADLTEETKKYIRNVTVSDLRAFHTKSISADSLILSLAGAVAEADLRMAATVCNIMPTPVVPVQNYPAPAVSTPKRTVAFVPAKESVDYMLGVRAGIYKEHPDFVPLLLAVNILGRPGFAGRLMQKVREEQGLTYGTYAFLRGFDRTIDGHIAVWATFAPSLFNKGKKSVHTELARLYRDGPTKEEFEMHRDLYVANWWVRLSKTDSIADAVHDAVLSGHGPSYIETFPQQIASATYADVVKATKTYLAPSRMSEAAAGTIEKDALTA